MAFIVDEKAIKDNEGGNSEEYHIPTSNTVCTLVSYAELGRHTRMFQGKPAIYTAGKHTGKVKPPEMMISMIFEFSGAQYSGDFPLCYVTSIYLGDNSFVNHLGVPEAMLKNELSIQFVNKTGYKKMLDAINKNYGTKHQALFQAVGMPLAVAVRSLAIKEDDKTIKVLDKEVPGFNPKDPGKNVKGWRYYTELKPEQIIPMQQEFGGQIIDMYNIVKPVIGEYTPVFDWDNPNKDAWDMLKPFQKRAIIDALDFRESAFASLVARNEELAKEVQDLREGKKEDKVQEESPKAAPTTPPATPNQEADSDQPPLPV